MTDEFGGVKERTSYDAYGRPKHRWAGDIDGDGYVSAATDYNIIYDLNAAGAALGDANYNADADLGRDGGIDPDNDLGLLGEVRGPLGPNQLPDIQHETNFTMLCGSRSRVILLRTDTG